MIKEPMTRAFNYIKGACLKDVAISYKTEQLVLFLIVFNYILTNMLLYDKNKCEW